MAYQVPEIFQPKELVESGRVNTNNKYITDNLGLIKDQADKSTSDIETKVDKDQIGVPNGLATLDDKGTLTQSEIPNDVARLDDSGVLREDQIPEKTLTHIFTANSLVDMLTLDAQQGDWCKRPDIGKTYVLTDDKTIGVQGWQEMASFSAKNDLTPIPPYVVLVKQDDWLESSGGQDVQNKDYIFFIDAPTHKQNDLGTESIVVFAFDSNSSQVLINYTVHDNGDIDVISNIPFNGKIIVSNLCGNSFGLDFVPYSIIMGYSENGQNKILSIEEGKLDINTSDKIQIIDSNKGLQTILNKTVLHRFPLDLSTYENGLYDIFILSDDISDKTLDNLLLINHKNYYTRVSDLPDVSVESIATKLDGSAFYYSIEDASWVGNPLCHIGMINIYNGEGLQVYNDSFNQNGYNTNAESINKDYLSEGLANLDIKIDNKITITSGQVLLNDKSRIIDINNLSFNVPTISQTDLNWYDLYLCGNIYGDSALSLVNHDSVLNLNQRFTSFYKICSLPAINKEILKGETINNVLYFNKPLDLFNGSCNNGVTIDNVPDNIKYLYCSVENNSQQEFNFGIQTFEEKEIQVSKEYTSYEVSMDSESGVINGYINISGMSGEFIPDKTIVYSDKELENELATSEGNDFKWTGNTETYNKIEKQIVLDINGPITNSISIKNKQTIKIPYKGKFTVQGGTSTSNLKIKLLGYEIR